MFYTIGILVGLLFIICIKLIIENNLLREEKTDTIQKVKQNIDAINQKQLKIFDKVVVNKSFNVDLNTEIKQISKEVLELHQDFIEKYARD